MINTAGHINNLMPHRMTIKITSALNRHKKAVNGSKILFLGAAYKADIDDVRESPALAIVDEICAKGGEVLIHEPHCREFVTEAGNRFVSQDLSTQLLADADCVVITTHHSCFDIPAIVRSAKLVVDLRNAVREPSDKVYKL
jgi:UDP-N-acetyl-D-glucosamine dehydrogenase